MRTLCCYSWEAFSINPNLHPAALDTVTVLDQHAQFSCKLRLHAAAAASVLVYGYEAWPITENATKWIGAWNAIRLSLVTDREIRDEYLDLSFDIVARTRARSLTFQNISFK